MKYTRERKVYEIDTIEIAKQEWDAANAIFKTAIQEKYPNMDVSELKHNTMILTDGTLRVEFRLKISE